MKSKRIPPAVVIGLVLLANFCLYLYGVRGPFMADDFANLANNDALLIEGLSWQSLRDAAYSSPSSPYGRPLAMLSFALTFTLAGDLEPYSAKFFNIVLHLFTGLAVYVLSVRLLPHLRVSGEGRLDHTDCRTVGLLVTCLWLFHPLYASTVLYAVQRMTVLSSLFMILGMAAYLNRRGRLAQDNREYLLLVVVIGLFTAAAFLCKENGLLLPGFLLLIDWFCFGLRLPAGAPRIGRWVWLGALILPTALVLAYLLRYGAQHWNEMAATYFFTIEDRFLTQFRVLTHYGAWLALLNPEPLGLYHDDIAVSGSLFSPLTTLWCALFWVAVCGLALWQARARQLIGFCILWFLWGHVLESSLLPLSPVFEHRNYLPGFGILLGFVALVHGGAQRLIRQALLRWSVLALVLIILPAGLLAERVYAWGNEQRFVIHSLQQQPDSALTLMLAANFLDSRSDYAGALTALQTAQRLNTQDAAFLLAETALRCENRPGESFDPGLSAKLAALTMAGIRTTTARAQFVAMVKVCTASASSDAARLPLYERMQGHHSYAVAMYSLYGLGVISAHRGDWPAALGHWDTAVARYPQAKDLQPEIGKLRERLRAGD